MATCLTDCREMTSVVILSRAQRGLFSEHVFTVTLARLSSKQIANNSKIMHAKLNNPEAKPNRVVKERHMINIIIPATCYIHLFSIFCQTTAAFRLQMREKRERHSKRELFKSTSIISNKLSCSWFE